MMRRTMMIDVLNTTLKRKGIRIYNKLSIYLFVPFVETFGIRPLIIGVTPILETAW